MNELQSQYLQSNPQFSFVSSEADGGLIVQRGNSMVKLDAKLFEGHSYKQQAYELSAQKNPNLKGGNSLDAEKLRNIETSKLENMVRTVAGFEGKKSVDIQASINEVRMNPKNYDALYNRYAKALEAGYNPTKQPSLYHNMNEAQKNRLAAEMGYKAKK